MCLHIKHMMVNIILFYYLFVFFIFCLFFSLQDAVNITSKLLKDLGEMQNSDLNANILVSCDKLEKFVIQYATLHMASSQNGSEAEISIEKQEIGEAF